LDVIKAVSLGLFTCTKLPCQSERSYCINSVVSYKHCYWLLFIRRQIIGGVLVLSIESVTSTHIVLSVTSEWRHCMQYSCKCCFSLYLFTTLLQTSLAHQRLKAMTTW